MGCGRVGASLSDSLARIGHDVAVIDRDSTAFHRLSPDFPGERANALALPQWHKLFAGCGEDGLRSIAPALPELVASELAHLSAHWPQDLPRSVIHADLFPDTVLLLGDKVCGLIDFYFACTDLIGSHCAVAQDQSDKTRGRESFR